MDSSTTVPPRAPFLFESERTFVVSGYAHGHGLLLLRSYHHDLEPRRIDLLFQDLWALDLRFFFEGIRIEEVDASFLAGRPSQPQDLIQRGQRVYAFHGKGWEGFLLGGIVSCHESDGGPAERSALLSEADGHHDWPWSDG